MKNYFVTEKQMQRALNYIRDACRYHDEWDETVVADNCVDLIHELEQQSVTEHYVIDDELMKKLVFDLFKMGKYIDCLESCLDVYENEDAKEILENIKAVRENMEHKLYKN